MGSESPTDEKEIEAAKWYKVEAIGHWDNTAKTGCDQDFFGQQTSCVIGAWITHWQDNTGPCVNDMGSILVFSDIAQFPVNMWGPYDNEAACIADL